MRNLCLLSLLFVACGGAERAKLSPALSLQDAQCRAGDVSTCVELMGELQHSPPMSDEYGERACAFGNSEVCEYVGSLLMTRGLAPRGHEDPTALFEASRPPLVKSSWKVCVSKTGRVTTVRPLKSSAAPAYDRVLVEEMRTWQYKPFIVDGVPERVCSPVTFVYHQRN